MGFERFLAQAGRAAAEGQRSTAAAHALAGADHVASTGQRAHEVLALHDVVRLGAHGEMRSTGSLHSPGGSTAAWSEPAQPMRPLCAKARARVWGRASSDLEASGLMLAAAEAATAAAAAHRAAGQPGQALAAQSRADSLAARCQGAITPSLSSPPGDDPLTVREREVVTLAARGPDEPPDRRAAGPVATYGREPPPPGVLKAARGGAGRSGPHPPALLILRSPATQAARLSLLRLAAPSLDRVVWVVPGPPIVASSADPPPAAVDFHFDIMCPYAFQTSWWIREVRDHADVDVRWRFFSLEEINRVEGKKHPWERPWSYGWSMMRIGARLRRDDPALLDAWYARAGTVLHIEGRKPHEPDVARELLGELGLDPGLVDGRSPTPPLTTRSRPSTTSWPPPAGGVFRCCASTTVSASSGLCSSTPRPARQPCGYGSWSAAGGSSPMCGELQRPKSGDDIKLIAERFGPYLRARDWITIQNETP